MARHGDRSGLASGVTFPATAGTRSTSAAGRAVLAAAARPIDPSLAEQVLAEPAWHRGYATHLRALTVAELHDPEGGAAVARAGLEELHHRFGFVRDGAEVPVAEVTSLAPGRELTTATITGAGRPEALAVPYRGRLLRGDELHRQLDRWVDTGIIEPGCADAIRLVMANPGWLDLTDRTVVVLGAGAEMGPFEALCRWGATVAPVDLPRPALWRRLLAAVRDGAGRALVPVDRPGTAAGGTRTGGSAGDVDGLAEVAGADLTTQLPEVATWLRTLEGPLVAGSYAYAHGADHVRVNLAADAVLADLAAHRDDVVLAGLLTPTDVYAVPEPLASSAARGFEAASPTHRALRALSGGRLFSPHHTQIVTTPDGSRVGIADALVLQQGPNYALAKRLQRWRFRAARAAGVAVSANVAPATRTRSVVSNRILAAAYAGAARFGVEVFDPATSNTLMAALLVRDLRDPKAPGRPDTPLDHPLLMFASAAAHGGLWRTPYLPRTALPVAAVLGLPRVLLRRGSAAA